MYIIYVVLSALQQCIYTRSKTLDDCMPAPGLLPNNSVTFVTIEATRSACFRLRLAPNNMGIWK